MSRTGETETTEETATGGAYGPFAHLNAPKAALYRRVMRALMAEKERFTVHVRPDQVAMALAGDGGDPVEKQMVVEALESLATHPAESPWDPDLAAVMAEHGRAVEEEAVADALVSDLVPDRVVGSVVDREPRLVTPRRGPDTTV